MPDRRNWNMRAGNQVASGITLPDGISCQLLIRKLCLESYGSVVYQREHFASDFVAMAEAVEQSLAKENWGAMTALSEAPVWGGGSWMSYTSRAL